MATETITVLPTHPATAFQAVLVDNVPTLMSAVDAARELMADDDLATDLMREAYATAKYDVLVTEGQRPGTYKVILWVDGHDEDLALEAAHEQWMDWAADEAAGR